MVKLKAAVIASLAIIVGVAAFYYFFQSEEAKIKKQFTLLAKHFSKKPDETKFIAAIESKKILGLFSKNVRLFIPAYSISKTYTHQDLSPLFLSGRSYFSNVSLAFYDFSIDFPETETATVILTARLTGTLSNKEEVAESHELECILKKNEKRWLFSDIKAIEVLKK